MLNAMRGFFFCEEKGVFLKASHADEADLEDRAGILPAKKKLPAEQKRVKRFLTSHFGAHTPTTRSPATVIPCPTRTLPKDTAPTVAAAATTTTVLTASVNSTPSTTTGRWSTYGWVRSLLHFV